MNKDNPPSRIKNIKNTVAPVLDNLVIPTVGILLTPLFLNKLGAFNFGIWLFLNSIGSLLGAFNAGIGDATIKFLTEGQINNWEIYKQTFQKAFKVGIAIITSSTVIAIPLAIYIPWGSLFSMPSAQAEAVWHLILATVFQFSLKQFETILLAPWRSQLRYDVASVFSGCHKLLAYLVQIYFLLNGQGIEHLIFGSLVSSFIIIFIETFFLIQKYPGIFSGFELSFTGTKHIFRFSIFGLAQSMAGVFFGQFDRLFVVFLGGPTLFSYYSIGAQITGQIHQIFTAGTSWILPLFSQNQNQPKKIDQTYSQSLFLILSIGLPIYFALMTIGRPLFETWLGTDHFKNSWPYIEGFFIYGTTILLTIPGYYLLNGIGKVGMNTFYVLTASVGNLVGVYLFHRLFGDHGLIWGRIVAFAFIIPIQIYFVFKIVDPLGNSLQRTVRTFIPNCILIIFYIINSTLIKVGIGFCLLIMFARRIYKLKETFSSSEANIRET